MNIERFLRSAPSVRYIKLKPPEVKYDLAENFGEVTASLMAKVVDYQDEVLCYAIIKYATENGYTDLFLIDEKFVKSAIIHEIERRKTQ